MNFGKWALALLAVMITAAVVGFMVDAVRIVAGVLFFGCLLALAARMLIRRKAD